MKSEKPRILYFEPLFPASSSGVLHSTVLAEAGYLCQNGIDCFFIGADISDEKAAEAEKRIYEQYGIHSKVFGCFSRKFRFISTQIIVRKVYNLSKNAIKDFRPTHIWTDFFVSSTACRKIARDNDAVSVFDVQAAKSEEVALERGRGLVYWISRWWEIYEFKRSDRLSGVSYKLKEWVNESSGRNDLTVVPCCFETENFCFDQAARDRIRNDLSFREDEVVICYSGGLSKWQRVPDILKLCYEISKIQKKYKFLFLTQRCKELKDMADKIGLPEDYYAIKSCLPQEVPQYLSSADAGIVMRDDIVVNRVASPIKIGEYLACGLFAILTNNIGDYSENVPKAGAGIIIDEGANAPQQIVDFIEKSDLKQLRSKAIDFAQKNISWESHLNELKKLYSIDNSNTN